MKEENLKKFRKNRIFYEKITDNGISFCLYRLTYNNKRFLKKALRLKDKLTLPAFIAGQPFPENLTEPFKKLLELNLFLNLCKEKKIKTAAVCDPKGDLCYKIDLAVKNLKNLKIRTENTEIYEDYADYLLKVFGTCPIIAEEKGLSGISYQLKCDDKEILLGENSFRAKISSVPCPEAEKIRPNGVDKEMFFQLVARFCRFAPLLNAVPERVYLNGFTLDINSIF